jgi:hypothetical protein
MQGTSIADAVRGAPEALIEQNAFHLQLKLTLGQRNQEIANLKEVKINQKREFEDLKVRFKTLDKTHQCIFPRRYPSESHKCKIPA